MILSHSYSEFVGETHLVVRTEILCDKRKICDTKNHAWHTKIDRKKKIFPLLNNFSYVTLFEKTVVIPA